MKQTVEEAAMQNLNLSYAIIADGELAYQQQAMLNMFKKGAEWALKEISEHVRTNMSYSDKAWDMLSYIEAIKGNSKPYMDYLNSKKASTIHRIDMDIIQQNISDIIG